jgi:glycosyltransferase involved in cell wall biosynthesis
MSAKCTFSVFTATFNRAYCLHRPYEGLKAQTFKDFEWVIIDDGSTDNTKELVETWQKEADFRIIYVVQPKAGKHFAFNKAHDYMQGKYFISVDSDDTVKPIWLERVKYWWDNFTEEDFKKIAGIMYGAENQYGKPIGDKFPDDGIDVDYIAYTLKNKVVGDKGYTYQMGLFKKYPFPEDVRNVYVPEAYFFHELGQNWKIRIYNEILIVPYIEDRADHTTHELRKPANYAGNWYGHLAFLKFSNRLFWSIPYTHLANATFYSKLSFLLNYSLKKQYNEIGNFWGRFLWVITCPLGFILSKTTKK